MAGRRKVGCSHKGSQIFTPHFFLTRQTMAKTTIDETRAGIITTDGAEWASEAESIHCHWINVAGSG